MSIEVEQDFPGMLKRFIVISCAVLLLAVAGMVWALARLDLSVYKAELAAKIHEKTGRNILFSGPVRLAFWPDLAVRAERVQIGNPVWASRLHMAEIGAIDFRFALLPLFQGRYVVREISVRDADFVWERVGGGGHNLLFAEGAVPVADAPSVPENVIKETRRFDVSLEKVHVQNLRLGYLDAGAASPHYIQVADLVFLAPAGENSRLLAQIFWKDAPFDIQLDLPPLAALMHPPSGRLPLAAKITYLDNNFAFHGDFDPSIPDFAGKLEAMIHQSRMLGEVKIDGRGAKPRVVANVIVEPLKLMKLDHDVESLSPAQPSEAPSDSAGRATGARYQKADKILDLLNKFDLVLDLDIRRIDGKKGVLGSFVTKIVIENGQLVLDRLRAQIGGGTLDGRFELRRDAGDAAFVVANLAMRDVNYGDVLAQAGVSGVVAGMMQGDLALQSVGADADTLQRNLQGRAVFDLGAGKIDTRYVKEGWFDRLRQVLPVPIDADIITVRCGHGGIDFSPGLARTKGFLFESDLVTFFAKGKVMTGQAPPGAVGLAPIDFAVHIRPAKLIEAKFGEKLVGMIAPIQIGGTLAAPRTRIDGQHVLKDIARRFLGGDKPDDAISVPQVSVAVTAENPCRLALEGGVTPQPVIPVEREMLEQKVIAPIRGLIDSIRKE